MFAKERSAWMSKQIIKEEQIYERSVYRITRKEKEDIHRYSAEGADDRSYRDLCTGLNLI